MDTPARAEVFDPLPVALTGVLQKKKKQQRRHQSERQQNNRQSWKHKRHVSAYHGATLLFGNADFIGVFLRFPSVFSAGKHDFAIRRKLVPVHGGDSPSVVPIVFVFRLLCHSDIIAHFFYPRKTFPRCSSNINPQGRNCSGPRPSRR